METMKRTIRSAASLVVLALLCEGCFYVNYKLKRSVDEPEGTVTLPGLSAEVTVRRDNLGIPMIEAENEDDLFLATGYAVASDRLWQMTALKMVSQGRLSELIGPDGLDVDLLMRTVGIRANAEAICENLGGEAKRVLEQFSAGVNAYLDTHDHLPIEFDLTGYDPEPWRPVDSLSVFGLFNYGLAANLNEELSFLVLAEALGLRKATFLFPVYPDEALPFPETEKLADLEVAGAADAWTAWAKAQDAMEAFAGLGGPASNNFALAGSRTASGRSIVANDTHLHLSMPSYWMIMHLKSPTYEAAGVAMPGIPIVTLGFNGSIAWGATMVMADNQDIFLEKLEERDGEPCYLYRGECLPLEHRREVFHVKGEHHRVRSIPFTRHGPLLNDVMTNLTDMPDFHGVPIPFEPEYGLAFRWTMADGERGLGAFYDMAKALDLAEAREALSRVDSIYLNIVYGDAANIAWQVTGRFPQRKAGRGMFPSPGWTGAYDWEGYLPFEEQPYAVNPPEGFLATANNKTIGPEASHHLTSSWYGPYRAARMKTLLEPMKGATYREAMEIQADQYSPMAAATQQILHEGPLAGPIRAVIESWDDEGEKVKARATLDRLAPGRFDSVMRAHSVPAALMGAFHRSFTRNVFLDDLGPEGSLTWEIFIKSEFHSYGASEHHLKVLEESPFFDDVGTPHVDTKADMIARSLADAYTHCEERMGGDPDRWAWGQLHTYTWRHPISEVSPVLNRFVKLNRGPFPAGGDMMTLNVTGYRWGRDFDALFIPAMRMVVDFGLDEPAFLISHGGQSGDPASPHYDDMIEPWMAVENQPLPFGEENIEAQYKDVLVLRPEGSPQRR